MRSADYQRLVLRAVTAQRLRSLLTGLGIAVGIAAVVLLTSIGEGVQRFVLSEFTQFGTTIVSIAPGRTTTHGGSPGMFGSTRPLSLADAEALNRVPGVESVEGVVQGNAEVEGGGRGRRTAVLGVGAEFPEIFQFDVALGRFLPRDDPSSARAFAVLGATLHEELFGERSPLGEKIRIGGSRFIVVGVMQSKGQVLGFDIDDAVYIPTARALELFNREGVMEVHVLYEQDADLERLVAGLRRVLIERHGREDFSITTQEQMLQSLGSVLDVLTLAVAALGGISLFVGAVGVLTIMTIGVRERTAEIGLLRALGARRGQILGLFLGEAVALAAVGGGAGLLAGWGLAQLLHLALPALPVHTSWGYAVAALALSALIGLLAGVAPALQAAWLDPIQALRDE